MDFIAAVYARWKKNMTSLISRQEYAPWRTCPRVAVQIADTLASAYTLLGLSTGIWKPANIMVADSGLVKVLDFGLVQS